MDAPIILCLTRDVMTGRGIDQSMACSCSPKLPRRRNRVLQLICLFLCGDVMTGRGLDQAMRNSCPPILHEMYVKDARRYVKLAEEANGPIPTPIGPEYIWGEALAVFNERRPDVRIINLETSVTTSDDAWRRKGIHYRMHPENISCLKTADIDCCVLANNHVLDWGYDGLAETLKTISRTGMRYAGAGEDRQEATEPAVIRVNDEHRVLVFASGWESSGIPESWAASEDQAGVNLSATSEEALQAMKRKVGEIRRPGDIVVWSVHWGGNWGYDIPGRQKRFARRMIDEVGVDVVHGHSSHHVKGFEIYEGRLILYGCGDFITDYEGISGKEKYRPSLSLMYFPALDPKTGALKRLEMVPTRISQFQIHRATPEEAEWLEGVLNREGQQFGTKVTLRKDRILEAR